MEIICPKCGQKVILDEKGRGFCIKCGMKIYACTICIRKGRKDYEKFVFYSPKALAGHMRVHKPSVTMLSASLASLEKAAKNLGIEAEQLLSNARMLSDCLASEEMSAEQLLSTLLLLNVSATLALAKELRKFRFEGARTPVKLSSYSEISDANLPSFVRRNPWLKVLSKRSPI